jgi:uncharacterized membrane protein HdeD (DUF308 family)
MANESGFMSKWWGRVAFGVIAIIFGVVAFLYPGLTVAGFLFLFGLFLLVSGLVLIAYAFKREGAHRWLNLAEGFINIVIAIIAFVFPGLTALTIVYLFAFFALISGILQIGESFFVPRGETTMGYSSRWFLAISGIWSLVIGVLLFLFPLGGILAVLWIVAIFAIIVGIINIMTGIRLRRASRPAMATP